MEIASNDNTSSSPIASRQRGWRMSRIASRSRRICAEPSRGLIHGVRLFDMADFEASTYGPFVVTFNSVVQNWAFNDGFLTTKVRAFELEQAVLDQINSTGALVVVIDRNASGDFYGIDYAGLTNDKTVVEIPGIPEPSTYALMMAGLAVIGCYARRRRS